MDTSNDPSPPRPWLLAESHLGHVRQIGYSLAILPMGATEPHNLHLPYGTDTLEADWIASQVAEQAWQRGARVVVLPAIPYGTETNLQKFPLAMNLYPSTLLRILHDLVESLGRSGIGQLLILNSHGGNEFKPMLRELYGQTDVQIYLCNWFQMIRDVAKDLFQHPDDHAGEMETSLILAYRPELVRRGSDGRFQADEGKVRGFAVEALEKGWVTLTRPWHVLTTESGSGNPHAATAEKGQRLLQVLKERLVPAVVQLCSDHEKPDFPFLPN